jgi:hypothetical protein
MNGYDPDSLHRVIHDQHLERIRVADAERLARKLRGTSPKRPWLRMSANVVLRAGHRIRALTPIPRPSHT